MLGRISFSCFPLFLICSLCKDQKHTYEQVPAVVQPATKLVTSNWVTWRFSMAAADTADRKTGVRARIDFILNLEIS